MKKITILIFSLTLLTTSIFGQAENQETLKIPQNCLGAEISQTDLRQEIKRDSKGRRVFNALERDPDGRILSSFDVLGLQVLTGWPADTDSPPRAIYGIITQVSLDPKANSTVFKYQMVSDRCENERWKITDALIREFVKLTERVQVFYWEVPPKNYLFPSQSNWAVKTEGNTTIYSYRLDKNYKLDIRKNENTMSFVAYDFSEFKYHTSQIIDFRQWGRSWELTKREWIIRPINQSLYKEPNGTVWYIFQDNNSSPSMLERSTELHTTGPDLMSVYIEKRIFDLLPESIKAEVWHLQHRLKPEPKK